MIAAKKDKKFQKNLSVILDALLDEMNFANRQTARDALKQIQYSEEEHTKVIDGLINALLNKQFWPYRNREFVEVLVEVGGKNATEPLCNILDTKKDEEHVRARAVAAYTLGNIRDKSNRVIDALLQCFVTEEQNNDTQFVGYLAWEALDKIKSINVAEPLLKAVEKNELTGSVRSIDAFGYDSYIPKLDLAFRFFGYCDEKRAIPILVQFLKDENEDLSYAAAGALINIGSPEALKELENAKESKMLGKGARKAMKDKKNVSFKLNFLKKWNKS